jgi:hypothetical protein
VCAGSEGGEADHCDEQGQQQQDQVDRYYLRLIAAEMDDDGEGLDESVADCRGAIEVGVVLTWAAVNAAMLARETANPMRSVP